MAVPSSCMRARRPTPAAQLQRYNQKRHFGITAEPRGTAPKQRGHSFVIQQHDATRMHYDFRLELDGVLKSWAVPKGPSLSPNEKRLAVQVEDHPIAYRDFEGNIPEGQYGGGPVIVWDRGTWTPDEEPHRALEKGALRFTLDGEKLHGAFSLVRLKGEQRGKTNWLLIKRSDEHVREGKQAEPTQVLTKSVISGKTVKQIGQDLDAPMWHSNRAPDDQPEAKRESASAKKTRAAAPARSKSRMPDLASIEPQLATLVERAPAGESFGYEIKFDGYRVLAALDGGEVKLRSRNNLDWTGTFSTVTRALEKLKVQQAILDGELCYVDEDGKTSFQHLQNVLRPQPGAGRFDHSRIVYFVFDLLFHDGEDLRKQPLTARKARLAQLVPKKKGVVRLSEHLTGDAGTIFEQACKLGLEGVIGKRLDAPYREGRGKDWIKLKCNQRQEFVIVGYTAPGGSRSGFGALLLGVYDQHGHLKYAGNVGTGFDEKTLAAIKAQLDKLASSATPFHELPRSIKGHWVEPKLVGEVSFTEWTGDGHLRHPVFHALRADKDPRTIVHEVAAHGDEVEKALDSEAEKPAKTKPSENAAASTIAAEKPAARKTGTHSVKVSNPGRVIDPSSGLTKLDLVEFYERVAGNLLPHLKSRPASLVRGPAGIDKQLFFQRHPDTLKIPGVRQLDASLWEGHPGLMEISTKDAIVAAAQFNVIEVHTWNAKSDAIEKPDRIILDLDPGEGVAWAQMVEAAQLTRALLDELKLKTFLKTSGGKGLHVVVPLAPRDGWDTVYEFSGRIVTQLARTIPQRFVEKSGAKNRVGKIFVDYLRNSKGATTVSAFSARARPGLGVSVPVLWDELASLTSSDQWTIANIAERLAEVKSDPWAGYGRVRQTVGAAAERLRES